MSLLCPADRAPMTLQVIEGHAGHLCPMCSGVWLPFQYLHSISVNREFSAGNLLDELEKQPKATGYRVCPSGCGHLYTATTDGITLDWCLTCQGVWFDRGEIEFLLEQYPKKNVEKITSPSLWEFLRAALLGR